jgi:hypothetical protein
MSEFVVQKTLKDPTAHPLFGQAVFIECGLHDPKNHCFDHHGMVAGNEFVMSTSGMVHQQMLQRREFPTIVVMNHVRHIDNIVTLYLLWYRRYALTATTHEVVAAAGLIDRVGPLAMASVPQMIGAVLETAQSIIPFREWEIPDEELQNLMLRAVNSLKQMVTREQQLPEYQTIFEEGEFAIVNSDDFIGNALYDQGYNAYVVCTKNQDGTYKWTFARASEYVPFNISGAFEELNALEAGWGGRPTIGGSPQGVGSNLELETVIEIAKKHWQQ